MQEFPVVRDILHKRTRHRFAGSACQHRKLGVAPDDFKPGVNQANTVVNRLQLGRFVNDMHRRRYLAAIMEQAGDFQFITVMIAHRKTAERPGFAVVDRIGQHHRQRRHALAMTSGIRRFIIDSGIYQLDERLKQHLQMIDQQSVGERYSSL